MRLLLINLLVLCLGATLYSSANAKSDDGNELYHKGDQLWRSTIPDRKHKSDAGKKHREHSGQHKNDTRHRKIHSPNSGASTGSGSSQPITYHGGPVIKNPVVYIIWYGNWDDTSATAIIENFVQYLGNTAWWRINIAYNNTAPIIYGGSAYDWYSEGTQLTGDSIYWIVDDAIYYEVLPYDRNGVYLVLTSSDCNQTDFCTRACGWHTFNSDSDIKYGWVGNAASLCPGSCGVRSVSPNGNPGVDALVSVVAHELAEAVSDPYINAWLDASGNENADKCAWTYGSTSVYHGAYYNVVLNGWAYLIQQNWKLSTQACAMY